MAIEGMRVLQHLSLLGLLPIDGHCASSSMCVMECVNKLAQSQLLHCPGERAAIDWANQRRASGNVGNADSAGFCNSWECCSS
jgi:hypothetical protein